MMWCAFFSSLAFIPLDGLLYHLFSVALLHLFEKILTFNFRTQNQELAAFCWNSILFFMVFRQSIAFIRFIVSMVNSAWNYVLSSTIPQNQQPLFFLPHFHNRDVFVLNAVTSESILIWTFTSKIEFVRFSCFDVIAMSQSNLSFCRLRCFNSCSSGYKFRATS